MKGYRFNSDKLFRNFVVLSTVVSAGIFVYKVANEGISWISTTGLLG